MAGAVIVESYHGGGSLHATWASLVRRDPGLPATAGVTSTATTAALRPVATVSDPAAAVVPAVVAAGKPTFKPANTPASTPAVLPAIVVPTALPAVAPVVVPAVVPAATPIVQPTLPAVVAAFKPEVAAVTSNTAMIKASASAAAGVASIVPMVKDIPDFQHDPETVAVRRKAATLMDPELMSHAPREFESRFKNPCWSTPGVRCLPYMYVAGNFHAGGATMALKLAKHPSIVTDGGSGNQFWAEDGKKMGQYLDMFRGASERIARDPAHLVLMDHSLSTFPFYWTNDMKAHRAFSKSAVACWKACNDAAGKGGPATGVCAAATCLQGAAVADRQIAIETGIPYADQHMPLLMSAVYNTRSPYMVVVARDPVARIHSAFWGYPHYMGKHGKTAEGFLAYVKEQVGAFRACEANGRTAQECAMYFESLSWEQEQVFYHCDQLMRGMYSVFLETWLRFIRRDHILVVKSEEYFADSKKYLQQVVKFLDLPEADAGTLAAMDAAGQPKSFTQSSPAMLPEARQLLAEFYKPYNLRLAQITGNPLFIAWNANSG